ncbi:alcohol-forming fatty acyl-CoA reductase [Trifolium repens]|nr:alcohol-forming fatty acyl-CoA reductase [Trifolium repens]
MNYSEVNEMWYDIDGSFKGLVDDKGAIEMKDWAKARGKVHLYLIHPISQPDFVALIEPEANAFEALMNDEELGSDDGDASVVSLEDSDDEHILDGEILIDEVVDSESKKKSKNKGRRPNKKNVTNPKCKGIGR